MVYGAEDWITWSIYVPAVDMATKGPRQRNRRGSRQDANNVNTSLVSDNRTSKEEKNIDDSKNSDMRNEWVTQTFV